MERYYSLTEYFKNTYGRKLYKLALDGGMTCPNRDGSLASGGCIFCSGGGSGEFAVKVTEGCLSYVNLTNIENVSSYVNHTNVENVSSYVNLPEGAKDYIAYLQAFTNTYAPVDYLERLYRALLDDDRFVGLSIGTRPDCLPDEVLALLKTLKNDYPDKFIWVELGFQTAHNETVRFIRRGYENEVFREAVLKLNELDIPVICHMILGLPYPVSENECENLSVTEDSYVAITNSVAQKYRLESEPEFLETLNYVNQLPIQGVKLQLLHVLRDTDLATLYEEGAFPVLTEEEYVKYVVFCLSHLRPDIVLHRITGDGPKDLLIAPKWSGHKHHVLNAIRHEMKLQNVTQGDAYERQ